MSTATVYRLIQNGRCSLFIDETEMLSSQYRASHFRNILLNGYKKGSKTYRNRKTEDGNWIPEPFEVYAPKMLANIEGLEDVLESRCIRVIMKTSVSSEITNREVDITDPIWQQIRDLLYPFLMENWQNIKEIYSNLDNETDLINRDWELWKPIIALARFFDGEESNTLYSEMVALARQKAEERQMESTQNPEFVLVEVLSLIVDQDGYYFLTDIRDVMRERFVGELSWLNERYIGSVLRRLGFSGRRHRFGYRYFLRVSEVEDCARRLGISVVSERSEHNEGENEQAEDQTSSSEQQEEDTS